MSNAARRVQDAARDARSTDDLVGELWVVDNTPDSPLDEETLDEQASTQMGAMYEPRRRDAN